MKGPEQLSLVRLGLNRILPPMGLKPKTPSFLSQERSAQACCKTFPATVTILFKVVICGKYKNLKAITKKN